MNDPRSRRIHVTPVRRSYVTPATGSAGMTQLDRLNSCITTETSMIDRIQKMKEHVDDQIDTIKTQNEFFDHDDDKKERIKERIRTKKRLNDDVKRRQRVVRILRNETSGLRGKSSKKKSSKKKSSKKKQKKQKQKKQKKQKKKSTKKKRRTRR